jgi:flagellar basal-body rod protein FlgB
MMMNKLPFSRQLFDRTIYFLERSLDLSTSRHKILSNNIANTETPHYTSKDIPFQTILERSFSQVSTIRLKTTHPDHFTETSESEVLVDSSSEGVNIDQEMAKLAQNNLVFQAGVQALVKKLEGLKVTIIEGGK